MEIYSTTHAAYAATLAKLLDCPDYVCSSRGMQLSELVNYGFIVEEPSCEPILTACPKRNRTVAKYLENEFRLYLKGELRALVWAQETSPFWKTIANPDGTINSNYGWLLFQKKLPCGKTPWEWVVDTLRADRNSRQAYAGYALPEHLWEGNKDQVSTLHQSFLIRENKLHSCVVMRSNDAVRGLVYDMPWFCYVQLKLARVLGEQVGRYTHFAHSMYLNVTDRHLAERMLGRQDVTNDQL